LSHCCGGNIVLTHKQHFMSSILQCFYNTFFFAPIWNCNQKRMWKCDAWY
jgi:hypothetical protein